MWIRILFLMMQMDVSKQNSNVSLNLDVSQNETINSQFDENDGNESNEFSYFIDKDDRKSYSLINILEDKTNLSVVETRNRITNIIECNFWDEEIKCGDICLGVKWSCQCGKQKITIFPLKETLSSKLEHCCLPPSFESKTQCYKNEDTLTVHCDHGKPLSLFKPCNGKCYNDYEDRNITGLGQLAMHKCDTENKCVLVQQMCRGYSLCDDNQILKNVKMVSSVLIVG